MNVCEIFTSIQGESSYAGIPCIFIRLSGCNLRCTYCDTTYAYDQGFPMSVDEILKMVQGSGLSLVEITGGEPLLQIETGKLVDKLIQYNYTVMIETNGSMVIKELNKNAVIIMDIKTPSSGMADRMNYTNLDDLKPSDEVKFVIGDRADYEWAVGILKKYFLPDRCKVLFSNIFGLLHPESLAQWIVEDSLPVRLNLQIHKYIFGKDRRGV